MHSFNNVIHKNNSPNHHKIEFLSKLTSIILKFSGLAGGL